MRYVKCNNCGDDIAGKPKYQLILATETKGKHRNAKRQQIAHFCESCGDRLTIDMRVKNIESGQYRKLSNEAKMNKYLKCYEKHEIEIKREWRGGEFGFLWKITDSKLKKSPEGLLVSKIEQLMVIATKFFDYIFIGDEYDIEQAIQLLKATQFIEAILSSFHIHVKSYMLNPDNRWIILDEREKFIGSQKKLDTFTKYLNQMKKRYLDKINIDDNPDLKHDVIILLQALYEKITIDMMNKEVFLLYGEEYIEPEPVLPKLFRANR